MTEKLMTFGMLCAIKREKLGYSLKEIYARTGVSNIRKIEKGLSLPKKNSQARLIEYYRITPQELQQCKNIIETTVKPKKTRKTNVVGHDHVNKTDRICTISRLIEELIDDVSELNLTGYIGEHVKETSLEQLHVAKKAINDLTILDKLL